MRPTDQLKDEQRGITRMLQVLEKICGKLESKERIPRDHLERIGIGTPERFHNFLNKLRKIYLEKQV